MKKYSNDNIFLNSSNDIIRNDYHSNQSIDEPPQNICQRNHDTNIFMNQTETFNSNNNPDVAFLTSLDVTVSKSTCSCKFPSILPAKCKNSSL